MSSAGLRSTTFAQLTDEEGGRCYINAMLQVLKVQPDFEDLLGGHIQPEKVTVALKNILGQMDAGGIQSAKMFQTVFSSKFQSFRGPADCSEFIDKLFEALKQESVSWIDGMFGYTVLERTTCSECGVETRNALSRGGTILYVNGNVDLQYSLSEFFDATLLHAKCESCPQSQLIQTRSFPRAPATLIVWTATPFKVIVFCFSVIYLPATPFNGFGFCFSMFCRAFLWRAWMSHAS
jgi:uncharacterized UBP type Zn finger protein